MFIYYQNDRSFLPVYPGTSHRLQEGHPSYSYHHHEQFEKFIDKLCSSYRIAYIAEEMTHGILKSLDIEETLARKVARRRSIPTCYVDIDESMRSELGIDRISMHEIEQQMSKAQFSAFEDVGVNRIREGIWLTRLLAKGLWPCLFICGSRHSESFAMLVNSIGIFSEVAAYDYDFLDH